MSKQAGREGALIRRNRSLPPEKVAEAKAFLGATIDQTLARLARA